MSDSLKEKYASTPLFAANATAVETLYEKYLEDPASVPDAWREYFVSLGEPDTEIAHSTIREELLNEARTGGRRKARVRSKGTAAVASGQKQAAVSRPWRKGLQRAVFEGQGGLPEAERRQDGAVGDADQRHDDLQVGHGGEFAGRVVGSHVVGSAEAFSSPGWSGKRASIISRTSLFRSSSGNVGSNAARSSRSATSRATAASSAPVQTPARRGFGAPCGAPRLLAASAKRSCSSPQRPRRRRYPNSANSRAPPNPAVARTRRSTTPSGWSAS